MDHPYTLRKFPRSRIASIDTYAVGTRKHHVSAFLEFDVTEPRRKLRELRRKGILISFNGWLIRVIAVVLSRHPEAAAFLYGKRKMILFDQVNVSTMVEVLVRGQSVPLPLVVENAQQKSAVEITEEIEQAKKREPTDSPVLSGRRASRSERIYYLLPGIVRRLVWIYMLRHPKSVYPRMGNAVVTSVGMMGKINGWFLIRSIHPVSFGIGSILRKAVVLGEEIRIREMLHMTVLIDHDVIDGAPMVRVLNDLAHIIESGAEMDRV